MFHRLFHRPIRAPQEGPASRLLVGLLLAGGVALPAVDAWAQNVPARATTCRIASFGAGQTSGGAWIPPQIGNVGGSQVIPDGTVLAVRSVTLTSSATLVPAASTDRYYLAAGATWTGVRPDGSTIFPTNVSGIGIRLRAGPGDSASEVQATTAIRAVRNIDQLIMLANMQMAPYILQVSLRVELVKMGSDVLPGIGAFPVTGMATAYQGASMRFKVVQVKSEPAAEGTDLGPITDPSCNTSFDFNIDQLISGGGTTPPVVTAVCAVDASYQGSGREVPMGPVTRGSFPGRGDRAGSVPFDISLSNCAARAKPKISFSPGFQGKVPGWPNVLRLDQSDINHARNLGIVLTRRDDPGKEVNIGDAPEAGPYIQFPQYGTLQDGETTTLELAAHYVRTDHEGQGGVTPGPANSSVRFQVRYD